MNTIARPRPGRWQHFCVALHKLRISFDFQDKEDKQEIKAKAAVPLGKAFPVNESAPGSDVKVVCAATEMPRSTSAATKPSKLLNPSAAEVILLLLAQSPENLHTSMQRYQASIANGVKKSEVTRSYHSSCNVLQAYICLCTANVSARVHTSPK